MQQRTDINSSLWDRVSPAYKGRPCRGLEEIVSRLIGRAELSIYVQSIQMMTALSFHTTYTQLLLIKRGTDNPLPCDMQRMSRSSFDGWLLVNEFLCSNNSITLLSKTGIILKDIARRVQPLFIKLFLCCKINTYDMFYRWGDTELSAVLKQCCI